MYSRLWDSKNDYQSSMPSTSEKNNFFLVHGWSFYLEGQISSSLLDAMGKKGKDFDIWDAQMNGFQWLACELGRFGAQ